MHMSADELQTAKGEQPCRIRTVMFLFAAYITTSAAATSVAVFTEHAGLPVLVTAVNAPSYALFPSSLHHIPLYSDGKRSDVLLLFAQNDSDGYHADWGAARGLGCQLL